MPNKHGEQLDRAIAYLKSFQPKVDKAARMLWTPLHGAAGVNAPQSPEDAAREEKSQDLQRQLDAFKYVQEQHRIKQLREQLTKGN